VSARVDPRAPVVVGVAQSVRHPEAGDELTELPEPATMMVEALRLAGEDSGTGDRLLRAADSVRVVDTLSWRYRDAPALVAEGIGASPRQRLRSTAGGNSPQMLVNQAAAAIARGELDVALVTGAEAIYTRLLSRKTNTWLPWKRQPEDCAGAEVLGDDRPGTSEQEMARSLLMPTQVYPVFENAIRAAADESVGAHQEKISRLWSRFSEVAAANPAAWSRVARTPEEIRTPSADNRMIGFPYLKLMNANIQTDQAAALVLCSVAAARSAGVPEERWVFIHAGADGHDHWFVSERADLRSSPAVGACGRSVLEMSGTTIDDVAHVDLYSCFPSAVQVAAAELGLSLEDPDRPLTVTGGLTFAGGPGNNYVTHSIAGMTQVLRAEPGSLGMVTALGWYMTKHSVALYGTSPPQHGFRWRSVQDEVDRLPGRQAVAEHDGPATVEAYTVMHERDGSPALGIVACLLADGRRCWANEHDTGVLAGMTTEEWCGRPVTVRPGGHLEPA